MCGVVEPRRARSQVPPIGSVADGDPGAETGIRCSEWMYNRTLPMDEISATSPIATFLADSDERCPVCRYALRGCASDRCPECGFELRLQVARPQGASFLWLVGMFSALLALGLALFFAYLSVSGLALHDHSPRTEELIARGFMVAPPPVDWQSVLGTLAIAMVMLVWAAACLAVRRNFSRWPIILQGVAALVALATPLGVLGAVQLIVGLAGQS